MMENSLHERIYWLEIKVKDQARTIQMLLDLVGYGTDRFNKDYENEHQWLPGYEVPRANVRKTLDDLVKAQKDIDPD